MIERDDKRPADELRFDDSMLLALVALKHLENGQNTATLGLRGGNEIQVSQLDWYSGDNHHLMIATTMLGQDAVFSAFDIVLVSSEGSL